MTYHQDTNDELLRAIETGINGIDMLFDTKFVFSI